MSNNVTRFQPSFDTCSEVTPLCPVEATTYGDYFNLPATIIFTVFYTLCLIYQIGIGIWGKTWSFSFFLGLGTIMELMGYAARVSMTPVGTVWSYPAFVIQLCMLILGPTLVAAAISVTFKWIVLQEGPEYSLFKPKWYPYVFVGTDFFSIVIQAAGGGVSASATDVTPPNMKLLDAGSGLLIAGTAFQAANMIFCGGIVLVWYWRLNRARKAGLAPRRKIGVANGSVSPEEAALEEQTRSKGFWPATRFEKLIWAIVTAYIAIIIRCIYRIPEMALGWGSTLMQNETLFLILDGTMIGISVLLLTLAHPAIFFPVLRKGNRAPNTNTNTNSSTGRETGIEAVERDPSEVAPEGWSGLTPENNFGIQSSDVQGQRGIHEMSVDNGRRLDGEKEEMRQVS